jgi:hypothetical protein
VIDFICILRPQSSSALPLPMRLKIQLTLSAYRAGFFTLPECLQRLFKMLILVNDMKTKNLLDELLVDALICWDDLEGELPESLKAQLKMLFDQYLTDATEISQVLGWPQRDVSL